MPTCPDLRRLTESQIPPGRLKDAGALRDRDGPPPVSPARAHNTELSFDGTERLSILVDGSLVRVFSSARARLAVRTVFPSMPKLQPDACPHGGIVRSRTAATESLGLCPPSGRRPIRTTTAWRTSAAARKPGVVLTTGLSRVTWGLQHRAGGRGHAVRRGAPLAADTQGR